VNFSLPWRTLAVASLLLNLGAIATVAVVASVQGADALATVALALAIIAFVCQLIIYSVQTVQSGQQLDAARHLNAATESLLTEARARIEGTNRMVATQYEEFLHLTVQRATSEANKESLSRGEGTIDIDVVEGAVRSVVEAAQVGGSDSAPQRAPQVNPTPTARELSASDRNGLASMAKWSADLAEVDLQVKFVEGLSSGERYALFIDMHNYALSVLNGYEPGILLGGIDRPLLAGGLVEEIAPEVEDGEVKRRVRLTEQGRKYGPLLLAPWPPPSRYDALAERIWAVREQMDGSDRRLAEDLGRRLTALS
jgi:hypothetical protein